jgi:hypothetical protein
MLRLNTKETSMNVVAAFATVLAASIGFIDSAEVSTYDNGSGSTKPAALIEIAFPPDTHYRPGLSPPVPFQ